ncbi:hypothetical protein YQ22_14950 [Maribacter sp. 1_2014MBL_MicDiv]|nr:hypothetical protein YQ22_14950 [Maribacter sp. 1_2014MBL_MicDiv]
MKNILDFILRLYPRIYNWFLFKFKNVTFSNYPRIKGKLMITGKGSLILGENVKINSSRRSNHIGEASRTIFKIKNKNATIKIGNNTGLSNTTFVCRDSIVVGNYVKIGGGVKIYDSDAHSLNHLLRMDSSLDIAIMKKVTLKDHCFIGAYSIILKGVTVGERSIVGAGSVVTKSIPDDEIWGGNPAKFIKKNINS